MAHKNPEDKRAYDRARYLANPEPAKARSRVRHAVHREEILLAMKARYHANPYPTRARTRQWALDNPAAARRRRQAAKQARRARELQDPANTLSARQWQEILEHYNYRCVYCPENCKACKNKTHILSCDHVTPFARNGSNNLWNVVPACLTHNKHKSAGAILKPVQPLLLTIAPTRRKYKTRKKE